jgi:hypothetical protein
VAGLLRRARLPAAAAALAAALVLVWAEGAVAADAPARFFGVQAWRDPGTRDFERMRRAGIRSFRANLNWSAVEPTPGERRWERYDAVFGAAARAGVEILPVIVGSPAFAARRPQFPPRLDQRAAYAEFVRDAVARYGRGGDLWRGSRRAARLPATHWQVWNEPNLSMWWNGAPDVRGYATLLATTRRAVRAEDRRARIVLAGMPVTAYDVQGPDYLRSLYALPGARRLFDVVATHTYARDAAGVIAIVARTRAEMRRAGDARKPIWVTELGWGTVRGANPPELGVGERTQARLLARTFDALLAQRPRHGVERAFWFSWRDRAPIAGENDWWALHTGLFRAGGAPKPAWGALRRTIRAAR